MAEIRWLKRWVERLVERKSSLRFFFLYFILAHYRQARHFRFCLGGANALEAQPEKNFAPQARKFFALFARKSSYTPPKNSFLHGFDPLWNQNQSFLLFIFISLWENYHFAHPLQGILRGVNPKLPTPTPPNDGHGLFNIYNILFSEFFIQ